ncbi:MAG TPA: hypothetical protein DDW23_04305 [Planctomycetes bacterium]|jgi:type II secretory pathway component GspD/PulD (secretin)|nr:hypothetical protein [Planctomycetota bacterium]
MKLKKILTTASLSISLAISGFAQESDDNPFSALKGEKITVNFQGEELSSVLEAFSTTYGLNLVYGPDIEGLINLNLYEAPVEEALSRILAANGFGFTAENGFLLIAPLEGAAGSSVRHAAQVFFLDHLRAKDAVEMLEPLLGAGESVVAGPESDSGIDNVTDLGGNGQASRELFVLYAGSGTTKKVNDLLQTIDIAPAQVLVEATILSIALSDDSRLGVDFTALGGVDFQALGGTSDLTTGIDREDAQLGGDDWLLGASTGGFTDSSGAGLHIGILRNQVGVFIEALEQVGNATVLSNPQILAVNRHAAQVLVGQKLPYQTVTTVENTSMQNVEFLEVGTSLVFRPFISEDGFIRMEIHPKNSSGNINAQGLPEETTTEVTTNILVKSGNTVVIGGLMESAVSSDVSQVPLLGSIPVVGGLFRSEKEVETRSEVVVLLTPRIVEDDELGRRASEALDRHAAAQSRLAAAHSGYLRPSYARRMHTDAAKALAAGHLDLALAKAEWGLSALPSHPELAALADHCRQEILESRLEAEELNEALDILQKMEESQ